MWDLRAKLPTWRYQDGKGGRLTVASKGKQKVQDASKPAPSVRETTILTGNHAASYAVKAARVQVISAYPITPQSPVVEKLSELVEDGE
jgi:hypothetical protein